jgi:hypothetical protein
MPSTGPPWRLGRYGSTKRNRFCGFYPAQTPTQWEDGANFGASHGLWANAPQEIPWCAVKLGVLPERIENVGLRLEADPSLPTAEMVLPELRELMPGGGIAVYLDAIGPQCATSAIDPLTVSPPRDGYSLELRLASWLIAVDVPAVRVVPTFLSPWLPMERCLVVPLVIEGTHRGALIVELGRLSRSRVRSIEELAARLAETIGHADERWFNRVDESEGPQSVSLWRVKAAVR